MSEREVIALMKSSRNEQEWNANCDRVKAACDGYPEFWFKAIILSGVINETLGPGSDEIKITSWGIDDDSTRNDR